MRIAVVTTSYPADARDPAGHFVAADCRALVAQGHRVTVLAPDTPKAREGRAPVAQTETDLRSDQPEVLRLAAGDAFGFPGALTRLSEAPTRVIGALRFALTARLWLHRHGPWDRVVAHWLLPSGWPIAAASPWPLELVAHGSDVRLLARSPQLAGWVLRGFAHGQTELRCVSQELATQLEQLAPELGPFIRVRPCRLDLDDVPPRDAARRKLGVEPQAPLVVVVGRLIPGKRVDVSLGALSLLKRPRVVVVGEGPERTALQSSYPSAQFLGALPRDQTLTWIAAADLLVTSSTQEGAPTVVREARALDVPVVCCDAGDLKEWARSDPELYVVGP